MLLVTQKSDLFRYYGNTRLTAFLKAYLLIPGFRFMYWHRWAQWSSKRKLFWPLFLLCRFKLGRYRFKFGIEMPWTVKVGNGFYIGHQGTIVISAKSRIGNNCNISHGVTLAMIPRGDRAGTPQIGNCVYIAPGAKLLGNVKIGDGAAIGANCVVTKDVPPNSVVVGVPGRVISDRGSEGYILNCWKAK